MGLSAAESLSGQSAQLAALGEKARAGDIESAQLLEKISKDRQAREQAGLDIGYEDFIRQRDMPREDLTFYHLFLGVCQCNHLQKQLNSTIQSSKRLLGTGIAGLGLYKVQAEILDIVSEMPDKEKASKAQIDALLGSLRLTQGADPMIDKYLATKVDPKVWGDANDTEREKYRSEIRGFFDDIISGYGLF